MIRNFVFFSSRVSDHVSKNRGIAALMIIVILGSAALILAVSSSLLGLGELDNAVTREEGSEALVLTEGCLDESLRRTRLNVNYGLTAPPSPIVLAVSNGSCTINVSANGSERTVSIVGNTSNNFYKKIEAKFSLSGNIVTLVSWVEKDDL